MNSNKEFLYNLIQKKEKQYEKKKTNRFIVTVLSFSVMFFGLFYSIMNTELSEAIFEVLCVNGRFCCYGNTISLPVGTKLARKERCPF